MKKFFLSILVVICIFESMILLAQFFINSIDTEFTKNVTQDIKQDLGIDKINASRTFYEKGMPRGENIQIWQLSVDNKTHINISDINAVQQSEFEKIEDYSIFVDFDKEQLKYNKAFNYKMFIYTYNGLKQRKDSEFFIFNHDSATCNYIFNQNLNLGLLIRVEN